MLKTALTLALGLLLSPLAHADALLDFINDPEGTPQARLSVAGTRLRFETAGSGAYTIIDLAARTLTQVNATQKTTTTTSIEQVQQIVAQLSRVDPSASPLLQLAMENLPDDQRRDAENLLRQAQADDTIAYVRTGPRSSQAGISCDTYQQHATSGDTRSLCVAPFAALGLSAGDERTLREALQLLRETGGPWLRMAEVPGLPIRYTGSFGNARYRGAGKLQGISREPLPTQRFYAPREYRLVSLLEMLSSSPGY